MGEVPQKPLKERTGDGSFAKLYPSNSILMTYRSGVVWFHSGHVTETCKQNNDRIASNFFSPNI